MPRMTFSEIQNRLFALAELYREEELYYLVGELDRFTPVETRPMSPDLAKRARTMKFMLPELRASTIAHQLRVRPQRVSEALREASPL
jgi:hypothetical protein